MGTMALGRRRPHSDDELRELLDAAGVNAARATRLLRDLLVEFPDRTELKAELELTEQMGDRLARDTYRVLGRQPSTSSLAFADVHALASAIDDVVDHTERTAQLLTLYAVEAPMDQAVALADVLVEAAAETSAALAAYGDEAKVGPHLQGIARLERDGDRLLYAALGSLFAGGVDPMTVIRWKDIFDSLEQAIDACAKVAHLLEGILLVQP